MTAEIEEQKAGKRGHKPLLAFLILFTLIFLIFIVAINYLSTTPIGRSSGLFLNSTTEVSNKHYVEITPAGWVFTIWLVIYAWQLLWLLYAVAGLFRKNHDGAPLYAHPETQSPAMYLSYLINLGCNLAWMLLFDRQYIGWCLIPIALLPFTLYVCMVLSHRRLMQYGHEMTQNGMRIDIWMIRIFIQNGMGIYATWTSIACLINFAMVLTYRANFDQSLACTISLSILLVEVTAWFILDLVVFERYTRYLVTPYAVVCIALAGSLAKNYNATANNTIATVVLLVVGIAATVVKVVMLFYRHFTRPVFSNGNEKHEATKEEEDTRM